MIEIMKCECGGSEIVDGRCSVCGNKRSAPTCQVCGQNHYPDNGCSPERVDALLKEARTLVYRLYETDDIKAEEEAEKKLVEWGMPAPNSPPPSASNTKAQTVFRSKVQRERMWLYFLDDKCDVRRTRFVKGQRQKDELVLKTPVEQREKGFLYFLDKSGNISKTPYPQEGKKK